MLLPAARAGTDPLTVALVGWERTHGVRHPKLTAKHRAWLQRYCRIFDRMAGRPGYGVEQLLKLMDLRLAWSRRGETALPVEEIHSLGFYVCQLRQLCRAERRRRQRKAPIEIRTGWLEPWWSRSTPAAATPEPAAVAGSPCRPLDRDATPTPPTAPSPVARRACECGLDPHRAWCAQAANGAAAATCAGSGS